MKKVTISRINWAPWSPSYFFPLGSCGSSSLLYWSLNHNYACIVCRVFGLFSKSQTTTWVCLESTLWILHKVMFGWAMIFKMLLWPVGCGKATVSYGLCESKKSFGSTLWLWEKTLLASLSDKRALFFSFIFFHRMDPRPRLHSPATVGLRLPSWRPRSCLPMVVDPHLPMWWSRSYMVARARAMLEGMVLSQRG